MFGACTGVCVDERGCVMPLPKVTAKCWLANVIERLKYDAPYIARFCTQDLGRSVYELEQVLVYVKSSRAPKRRRRNGPTKW